MLTDDPVRLKKWLAVITLVAAAFLGKDFAMKFAEILQTLSLVMMPTA